MMIETSLDKPHFAKLDTVGDDWVHECLKNGGAFSKVLLSKLDLYTGTVSIAIATPEHQEAVQKHQLLQWGTAKIGEWFSVAPQTTQLLHALKQLEKEQGPLAVIVEDDLAIGDITPKESLDTSQTHKFKGQYLSVKDSAAIESPDDLSRHLSRSVGHPLNVFVIPVKVLPKYEAWDEADVESITPSLLGIINSAYDGETYTLWLKNQQDPELNSKHKDE